MQQYKDTPDVTSLQMAKQRRCVLFLLMRNYLLVLMSYKNDKFYARENTFNHLRLRSDILFDTGIFNQMSVTGIQCRAEPRALKRRGLVAVKEKFFFALILDFPICPKYI